MTTPQYVLFLCPHAAAKSVLAMTYFTDLAQTAALDVIVWNAGTEPDAAVHPAVEAYLKDEGFDLTGFTPNLLTDADLHKADIIISMGCINGDKVPEGVRFIDWSDVPMLSDGFQASRDKIYAHTVELVKELSLNR